MIENKKTRLYPKCFHTNQNSIFIYNLLNENNLSQSTESKYLFSIYTLLLCALNGLNTNLFSKEKIILRISRSLNIEGNIDLNHLFKIIKILINKDLNYFKNNLKVEDYQKLYENHILIEKKIINELKQKLQ